MLPYFFNDFGEPYPLFSLFDDAFVRVTKLASSDAPTVYKMFLLSLIGDYKHHKLFP